MPESPQDKLKRLTASDIEPLLSDDEIDSLVDANGEVGEAAGFRILKSNNVPNAAAAKYKIIAGHSVATSYVDQIVDLQTYKPEKRFGDAVKGLHVYGAKVVRPTALAMLIANKA